MYLKQKQKTSLTSTSCHYGHSSAAIVNVFNGMWTSFHQLASFFVNVSKSTT